MVRQSRSSRWVTAHWLTAQTSGRISFAKRLKGQERISLTGILAGDTLKRHVRAQLRKIAQMTRRTRVQKTLRFISEDDAACS